MRVKPPRVKRKEAKHFEANQVSYILELLESEPIKYKAMVYLCIFGGMRAEELNALEWSDLDFDNKLLRIRQASQYLPGQGTFTKLNGEAIFPQTLGKWFSKFIKKHNNKIMKDTTIAKGDKWEYLLDTVNFHGLRHTNATLLIGEGMDIATVSKRLGHADISTTLDIYTHALQKSDRTAADKLENLFNKKKEVKKQG